jgi:SseB protein N-terminal domain/SseB protein C-terminal domain
MIDADELTHLLLRAQQDKGAEPTFFYALLEALVYAHAPLHDDTGRIRLIQFARPDGLTVLPFFSDEVQAQAASGPGIRVLKMTGRDLMEATRGATLMLNPNGVNCTLYPEEVAALLDQGRMATIEKVQVDEHSVLIDPPTAAATWLVDPLRILYGRLDFVRAAYLVEFSAPENPDQAVLLIAMAVPRKEAERAARATITAIQPACESRRMDVDLVAFEPDGDPPAWLRGTGVEPFYVSEDDREKAFLSKPDP